MRNFRKKFVNYFNSSQSTHLLQQNRILVRISFNILFLNIKYKLSTQNYKQKLSIMSNFKQYIS
ncbi:unnamed protein product [Paramecium sonneborni]|uniref:Uncharacterized protein n=1 Tax=Paramecium sonneborni TaxID=65129 RepID=A0A8S1NZY6_9CILI|nr:unnamed protein product [Paramecium sonneborni]